MPHTVPIQPVYCLSYSERGWEESARSCPGNWNRLVRTSPSSSVFKTFYPASLRLTSPLTVTRKFDKLNSCRPAQEERAEGRTPPPSDPLYRRTEGHKPPPASPAAVCEVGYCPTCPIFSLSHYFKYRSGRDFGFFVFNALSHTLKHFACFVLGRVRVKSNCHFFTYFYSNGMFVCVRDCVWARGRRCYY